MELFDIVDENGTPTGKTVERSVAHANGIRHRTAHVWVVRERGGRYEILLQKRASGKDSFPDRYDTSSAGHVQAGDEPLPSALREMGEELGITATAEELESAGVFIIKYEKEFHGKMFRDNEIAYVFVYKKDVDIKELTLQTEEVSAVEWFDLEDTYGECKNHNKKFCIPLEGLETLRGYLYDSKR